MKQFLYVDAQGREAKTTTEKPTLKEAQEWVGGWVECAMVGDELIWCNEEGLLKGLPVNDYRPPFVGAIIIESPLAGQRKAVCG